MAEKHIPMHQQNTGTTRPPDSALRQLLADAIKHSGKKRLQIVTEMASLVGLPVTQYMLDDFTSRSHRAARFPAAFVRPFCSVVGARSLYRLLLDEETLALIEVGRQAVACKHLLTQIATPKAKGRERKKCWNLPTEFRF
jgi:hypothetical protein